ncbi:cold shock domain-containing protein CG9705 [Centruroides vittatus]|uniref:cold shock domain-containing protein CG9705-like n=1 Tax=Centruroides sculpturatus TaxID=218467 RepID=UPI000C6C902C|nr:cold shock domain-containing protein CG9705-like [Centruroides sculpturatus]XP_023227032.1 cold shock domain-containing protein CG9705-like [Centruroides sculpturatus]XP_023227033.1 cold shock domain-containing protein CG9705-like [Centruroides sculpturatus]XP_023227034.1 cold shock domain-containing protein CG9705-like [Centruroides sculpturatus]
MSDPINIPTGNTDKLNVPSSPTKSPHGSCPAKFQIPSPVITRRTRTYSASERAAANPVEYGKVKYFCRQRGHGFITPSTGAEDIFFHISDIEGEYAPCPGDDVSYKLCLIPPKNEKMQAVHVVITNLGPGTHERWDCPPSPIADFTSTHN